MATPRRPTLRDVAIQAGVSFKTVSRVVNGERGVSPELIARVQAAVTSLDYRPDHRARLLRQTGADATTIGFVLVDIANPFFSRILRGIELVASTRNCLVLAGSTEGSVEREQQLIEALVGRRVDGLIVVSSGSIPQPLRSEIERGTPVVFVDIEPQQHGSSVLPIDLVRSDHTAGARAATQHLLDRGHTDIAYAGDDTAIYSAGLRLDAFRDTMRGAGSPVAADRITTGSHSEHEWEELAIELLNDAPRPTAIFSAQNFATVGVVRAMHRLGLRQQIAQVGFDDVELADVVEPGITVVPQQPRELGRRAAEILMARIDGDHRPPVQEILNSPLIERGSGEIPA